jgi:hypothetical protein
MNYVCKKCNYKTKLFSDITRHLNRKRICDKLINEKNYSEEELIKLSLIQNLNNIKDFDVYLLKKINKNIIKKEKLFKILSVIDKNKLKECPLCNELFTKIIDLKNHLILDCVSLDMSETQNSKPIINLNNNITNIQQTINKINNINNINNIHNTHNTHNIQNIQNINIININNIDNINNSLPISFDENWDCSHMTNDEKNLLILSMFKYTKTLEALLKNKINHNVIIDTESKSGLVYKNNKIEKMCLDEIMDKSFDKIFNHLTSFFEEVNNNNNYGINPELINNEKLTMKIKYDKFKLDDNNKKDAILHMTDSFIKIKDETLEQFNILKKIDNGF